jgi:ribosomal protein S18 acetylase RimI-like enzyme
MDDIRMRPATPADALDFAQLLLISVPRFLPAAYGPDAVELMARLFSYRQHYFSYQHTRMLEVDGRIAGMTLAYNHAAKRAARLRFGFLLALHQGLGLLRRHAGLLKIEALLGTITAGEYYASNSALYPEFRGRGLGLRLFAEAEEAARREGCRCIVSEAESENATAIAVRRKLGFRIERKLCLDDLNGQSFEFVRLIKELS